MAAQYERPNELKEEELSSARLDAVLDRVSALIESAESYDHAAKLYFAAMVHDDIKEVLSDAHFARILDIAHDLDRRKSYHFCGEILEPALRICVEIQGTNSEIAKELLYEYAENLRVREHYIEAVYHFAELNSAAVQSSLPTKIVGLLYKNYGLSLLRAGLYPEARKLLDLAREFYVGAEGLESSTLNDIREGLGEIEFREGNHAGVIELFEESISSGRGAIAIGLLGLTALVMPRDSRYFDDVRANVERVIDQTFENKKAYAPLAFHQLRYLFQAAFVGTLDDLDLVRFVMHVNRFTEIAKFRMTSIADSASQSSVLAVTSAVSDTLDRILSIVVEYSLNDPKLLRCILELGQVTKGAVTRLLRGRRIGSPSGRWDASLQEWYSAMEEDWRYRDARRAYEMQPSLAPWNWMERCDRDLSERMSDWNAYRYLGVRSDPPEDGTLALEYFSFVRLRPGQTQNEGEPWIASILRWRSGEQAEQTEDAEDSEELVLTSHGPVRALSSAIDELRQALFLTMQMGDGFNWQRKAAYLGRTMLPQFPAMPDRPRLIVIPDEYLHLVPFDVLVTNKGDALHRQFRLSFAQSWRDIDDLLPTRGVGLTSVCIGDPDFTMAEAMHCLDEGFRDTRLGAIWQALERRPFAEFGADGMRSEIEEVASIIGVVPLTGPEATATELRRLNAPGILHISTHGFYVGPDQIREHLAGAVQVLHDPATGAKHTMDLDVLFQNPQNRSGLIFAGANLHLEGKQGHPMLGEGFVFASEIEALDLRHTELVTLSACVTGAGDQVEGDGIAGVRRAFFAAGAESVISTIWDVPVDSTRDLFVRFYEGLKAGLSRGEALEAAKAAIAEAYPGEHYRHCGFQLHGATEPVDHIVDPNRLVVEWISAAGLLGKINETPKFRMLLEELRRIGIDFEASNCLQSKWLRMAYHDRIWSIASLKALSEDEAISGEDRERFGVVLRRIHLLLGCRSELGAQ